jgi:hypothetical protein
VLGEQGSKGHGRIVDDNAAARQRLRVAVEAHGVPMFRHAALRQVTP